MKIGDEEIEITDVIGRFFKDDRVIYPIIPDMQKNVQGEFYLSYQKIDGIELYAGTDDGEILICKTRSGERLERIILALIY